MYIFVALGMTPLCPPFMSPNGRAAFCYNVRMAAKSTSNLVRWLVAAAAFVVIATIAVTYILTSKDPLYSAARRSWRDDAVARIRGRAADKQWLDHELASLQTSARSRPLQGGWVGSEVLLMKNGDWIICQNVCSKDQNTPVKRDLFVGFGSDGKWYYSTFHFCVDKCVLQIESQPPTLSKFINAYWLAPFDGRSDDSLQPTWVPGQSYGDEKLQEGSP
jgi:hypothetical protein